MTIGIRAVDHIGIAVADLDAAVALYTSLLGTGPTAIEEIPDQQVRTAFFAVGDLHLELLVPTADTSPIAGFLAKRGPGIHHICFEVPDLDGALAECRRQGLRLVDETPRGGAHGKRVAFLHPKATGGVLLELCQARRETPCSSHPRTPHT